MSKEAPSYVGTEEWNDLLDTMLDMGPEEEAPEEPSEPRRSEEDQQFHDLVKARFGDASFYAGGYLKRLHPRPLKPILIAALPLLLLVPACALEAYLIAAPLAAMKALVGTLALCFGLFLLLNRKGYYERDPDLSMNHYTFRLHVKNGVLQETGDKPKELLFSKLLELDPDFDLQYVFKLLQKGYLESLSEKDRQVKIAEEKEKKMLRAKAEVRRALELETNALKEVSQRTLAHKEVSDD